MTPGAVRALGRDRLHDSCALLVREHVGRSRRGRVPERGSSCGACRGLSPQHFLDRCRARSWDSGRGRAHVPAHARPSSDPGSSVIVGTGCGPVPCGTDSWYSDRRVRTATRGRSTGCAVMTQPLGRALAHLTPVVRRFAIGRVGPRANHSNGSFRCVDSVIVITPIHGGERCESWFPVSYWRPQF